MLTGGKLLDDRLGEIVGTDEERELEEKARLEKELPHSGNCRCTLFWVASGGGHWQRQHYSPFCAARRKLRQGKFLLAGPYGKRRRRIEQAAKDHSLRLKGQTIAQF